MNNGRKNHHQVTKTKVFSEMLVKGLEFRHSDKEKAKK